jgi:hypothetical protein
MTNPNPDLPTPTASQALALAFGIVATPCSAAESQRAEILLGIAREIREESQYRRTAARFDSPPPPASPPDFAVVRVPAAPDVTAYMPAFAEQTQHIPILWRPGDKADCRNCHTPIIFVARRMSDPLVGDEGDDRFVWVHKYTDQRVCAAPMMAVDAEGSELNHTFAEPVARG